MERIYSSTQLALHKETTMGAKDKADAALKDAQKYVDEKITTGNGDPESVNGVKHELDTHVKDRVKHITMEDRAYWNAKETPAGATQKVDAGLAEAKKYTNDEVKSALKKSEAYAEQAIEDLIDGSPETLNTLKKIAEALENDPYFANSLSNKIGEKLDKAVFDSFVQSGGTNEIAEATEESKGLMGSIDKKRSNGYTHNQISPETTWSIKHNLDKFPAVTVVDSGGGVVVGNLSYASKNEVVITFTLPFSGMAFIS